LKDDIRVEKYRNNDELDIELEEYWDSFLETIT
jgi:hypothetical protein